MSLVQSDVEPQLVRIDNLAHLTGVASRTIREDIDVDRYVNIRDASEIIVSGVGARFIAPACVTSRPRVWHRGRV